MSYLLSFTFLFFCLGCFSQPTEGASRQPKTIDIIAPPGVSFGGETVIEPMLPIEELEMDHTTSAMPSRLNPRFAADAQVQLPKVADLVPQIDAYVKRLEKNLDDLDGSPRFIEDADTLHRDANALALIALALGLSQEENPYQKAAPVIIEAALKLETVKTFDDATKAMMELKRSLKADGDPTTLRWDKKVASLSPIMKAVPNINTLVKRNLRTEAALKKGVRIAVEGAAVMAAIGQGSIPNLDETIKPDAAKEWTAHCIEFRDAALALNRAASDYEAEKGKFSAVQDAYEALSDSCDSCHKLFYHGEIPEK